jgi:hypothetical protein
MKLPQRRKARKAFKRNSLAFFAPLRLISMFRYELILRKSTKPHPRPKGAGGAALAT